MATKPLTEHLQQCNTDTLEAACEHPFLLKAGQGKLTAYALCKWLVQDKYYQFGYLNFIGQMCANLSLDSYAFPKQDEENLEWKTFNALSAALNAIKDEIDFYNETVDKYDLDLSQDKPDEITQNYRRLFRESSAPGKPVSHGLTVLWATEFCYLKAWSYAKEKQTESVEGKGAVAALHQAFIPRWTSDEFKAGVDALADVLNQWAKRDNDQKTCEQLWAEVVELEAQFWPKVGEGEGK